MIKKLCGLEQQKLLVEHSTLCIHVTERSRRWLRDVRLPGGLNMLSYSALSYFNNYSYVQPFCKWYIETLPQFVVWLMGIVLN